MTRRKNLGLSLRTLVFTTLSLAMISPALSSLQARAQAVPEVAAPEVVDRTIAVVNKRLITWSDLDLQMRFEALENQRPLAELGESQRRQAFEHLVEYRALGDQMQGTAPAEAAEVDARLAEERVLWHAENDAAKWTATLNAYDVSPAELRQLVTTQLDILHFIEFQVKPLVRVSRAEVEEYYSKTLAPQVMAAGQTPEPLEDVTAQIRELLAEQKTSREMEKWVENLKAQSKVQLLWDGVRDDVPEGKR